MPDPSSPPERLLAELDWLRGLARRLVRDADLADDVVQDTLAAALERDPAAPRGRSPNERSSNERTPEERLRAWLAVTAKNFARRRRRAARVRSYHERRAAEGHGDPHGGREELERLELQRRLADAVLDLDEPYRSAVLLRHRAGLGYTAIAARQGVSPAAARKRVSRGLAFLRARLDAEFGEREAWCLALGLVASRRPGPPSAPTLGGIAMGTKSIVAGVAVAAAVALGVVSLWTERNPAESEVVATAVRPPEVARTSSAPEVAADPRHPREVPRELEEAATSIPEPPVPAPLAQSALEGVVLDAEGAPVAGARVALRHDELRGFNALDLEHDEAGEVVARARTDDDGRFSFPAPPARRYDVAASAPGFAESVAVDRHAGEAVEIVLGPEAAFRAAVVREDGTPVEGARVRGTRRPGVEVFEGRTDADGQAAFGGLAAGTILVRVDPPGLAPPPWADVRLEAGATAELRLVARPGPVVTGRVVDAVTGIAIEGAEVGLTWVFDKMARTDAGGWYRIEGLGSDYHEVHARADGYAGSQLPIRGAREGEVRIDFALEPDERARGRVVDASGGPIEGAYVAAVRSWTVDHVGGADWLADRTDDQGRYEILGLRPGAPYSLFVRKSGFGTCAFEMPRGVTSAVRELDDVVLHSGATLSGTVVDRAGEPAPDVVVVLDGEFEDRLVLSGPVEELADTTYVDKLVGRTDERGRFAFGDLAAGKYAVRGRTGGPVPRWKTVFLERGETREGVRILHDPGRVLEGTVVAEDGSPVSGVIVTAAPHGSSRASDLTRADGRFRLEKLGEGKLFVQAVPTEMFAGGNGRAVFRTALENVDPAEGDLRIVLPEGVPTKGRVVDASGAGVSRASVRAVDPMGERLASVFCDVDGTFELQLPVGSLVDLFAATPPEGGPFYLPSEEEPAASGVVPSVAAGMEGVEIVVR